MPPPRVCLHTWSPHKHHVCVFTLKKKKKEKIPALSFFHMRENKFVRVTSWWNTQNFGRRIRSCVSCRSLFAQLAAHSLTCSPARRPCFQALGLVYSGARQVALKAFGRVIKTLLEGNLHSFPPGLRRQYEGSELPVDCCRRCRLVFCVFLF